MTREEAIEMLMVVNVQLDITDQYGDGVDLEPYDEAIDMAIEALSAPTDGDLISRQDAIEAVAQQWLFEASVVSPYVNDDDIDEYRQLAGELFKDIPSARPTDIVRCKDCKHKYVSGNGTTQYYVCDFAQYEDDGFCSHGKRRGEDDE